MVSMGTLAAAAVHPRDVFREAIRRNAAAVLIAHNHPSGNPEPSRDDLELTKRLSRIGTLVGIEVLDHLIITKGGYVSLRERGETFDDGDDEYSARGHAASRAP
jgi:DNA repair protein RadC